MKHLTAEPDVSALAEPFRETVHRALAKDPAVRFSTVEELLSTLPESSAPPAYQSMRRIATASPVGVDRHTAETLPHPQAAHDEPADEEPIWRWLRSSYRDLASSWRSMKLATPLKVLIVLTIVILLARTANRVLPLLIWATVIYLIYRVVRAVWLRSTRAHRRRSLNQRDNLARAGRHQLAKHALAVGVSTASTQPTIVLKSPREQLADLLGSLLISAIASLVVSLVMVLLRGQPPEAEQYAWIALVSMLGSWGILIPAKFWERNAGEPAMRRFVMLVVGLGLGAVAYSVDVGLWVDLPFDLRIRPVDDAHIPKSFYSPADGSPLLHAYLAYFGFLFLLVRWWRVADPLRQTRLNLWATLSALFVAWVLNFVWPFPQPWGFMVTATISIAVQLASPWSPAKPPRFRTANNI